MTREIPVLVMAGMTEALGYNCRMPNLTINTSQAKQIVDITDQVNSAVKRSKLQAGLCHLFLLHTTAALTTADLDPGTDLDYLDAFAAIMPKLKYRHPHNPNHANDHILASILGPTLTVPIVNFELQLGTWQRVVLVELDGPRQRQLVLSCQETN